MEMNKRNEHRSEREIINIYCTWVSFECHEKIKERKKSGDCGGEMKTSAWVELKMKQEILVEIVENEF